MSGFKINENFEGLDELSEAYELKGEETKKEAITEASDLKGDIEVPEFVAEKSHKISDSNKKKKKKSKAKKRILDCIIIILVGVIVFCVYNIGMTHLDEYNLTSEMDEIEDALIYNESVDPNNPENNSDASSNNGSSVGGSGSGTRKPAEVPTSVDFEKLKQTNSDTVAWIYSKNGVINYPVVKTNNNDYYLKRSFYKKKNANGSIFMDYRSNSDFSSANTVIYGHSMDSGKMFKTLLNYKKQSYYDKYPVMYIFTPQGKYTLEIFAAYETNSNDMVYGLISGQNAVNKFLNHAKSKSKIKTSVEVQQSDKLVSLSTCAYSSSDAKFVVVGKLVKESAED